MEYTGRGRELLIGFLLALAVLSPIYSAISFSALRSNERALSPRCRCSCCFSCSRNSRFIALAATG
jgi:hypothetical protein